MITFQDRIRRRLAVWWGQPGGWRSPGLWRRPLHHLLDRQLLRNRHLPLERWRCCDLWQRCLNHKWNSKEFAAAYGVQVPKVYWIGHRLSQIPVHSLPEHVVLKPSWSAGGRGGLLLAGEVNLLSGERIDRLLLREELIRAHGRITRFPFLAEEMMTSEEGSYRQAAEYNFFMFGGYIGAIMRVERYQRSVRHYSMYTQEWTPIKIPYLTSLEQGDHQPVPKSFAEMCRVARLLGEAVGTFIRVDLYSTSNGVFFGEFSSTPRVNTVSVAEGEYLGRIWQEKIPNCT